MFGNLIESSSHKGDYTRKGSFFLGTLGVYALAFVVIGVGSIYAYSTKVENPDLRLVTLVTPVDTAELRPVERSVSRPAAGAENNSRPLVVSKPPDLTATNPAFVNENTPVARPDRELPVGSVFKIGIPNDGQNRFGSTNGTGNGTDGGGTGGTSSRIDDLVRDTPPPARVESKPPTKIIKRSNGPINGQATYLPKPVYTSIAKAARAWGLVTVEVLIDESGKVVSAHALNGNPLLAIESVRAAYLARFSPTTLGSVPVKVSGVITYNFVLQ